MKKLILWLAMIALGAGQLISAQSPGQPTRNPGNDAGLLYASTFGLWSIPQGNQGQFSWSAPSLCTTNANGIPLNPVFAVGTPIYIKDQVPANSEIVVPTAVTVGGFGCSITVNPVNPHKTFTLTSATGGLQEAINYAHGLPYEIVLTPDWTRVGGTTGTITAATGITNISILDARTACLVPYIWNGAVYTNQGNLCSGGGGFTINSFTGCAGSLELGQTVTNPTCVATYTGVPSSANITNTDSIDSPLVLSSPFTTGTIVGSFHHSAIATTTVTLTATGASTQTATQQYTWQPRIFGGVGTAGATSTVTASDTTAVLSTSDALPSAGLGAETVGQTFGPYTPSAQNVYLLLLGGSHTFIDAGTGFPFAFNPPITVTFVNEFGVTVTMYLYQSTNPLYGTYTPKVAS
jgi:hypothetical protein